MLGSYRGGVRRYGDYSPDGFVRGSYDDNYDGVPDAVDRDLNGVPDNRDYYGNRGYHGNSYQGNGYRGNGYRDDGYYGDSYYGNRRY